MGIKTPRAKRRARAACTSEKPPHHMGIKTPNIRWNRSNSSSLKNLPTTWGLRRFFES